MIFLIILSSCNEVSDSLNKDEISSNIKQVDTSFESKDITKENTLIRNPDKSLDVANVYWKRGYTLFDLTSDEPIFPIEKNGKKVYRIYYSSNEVPSANFGEFSIEELEKLLFFKFKNKENCLKFCNKVPNSNSVNNVSTKKKSGEDVLKCKWCNMNYFPKNGWVIKNDERCEVQSQEYMFGVWGYTDEFCSQKCAVESCRSKQ
jgi:hypothetical protein